MKPTRLLKVGLLAVLIASCGPSSAAPPASIGELAIPANGVGRTVCAGSVPDAAETVPAAGAGVMERLQATYEGDPGFLAVVWDNRQPVIVVARGDLAAWQAQLAPLKTAVAPSCVDQTLFALVHEVLPRMPNQGVISGGYNAVDDAIFVSGVDADALLAELDALQPGAKAVALTAIADGTLRLSSADSPGSRG
jgi:hypothetical protein